MEPATKIESNEGQLELFEMAEEEEFFELYEEEEVKVIKSAFAKFGINLE